LPKFQNEATALLSACEQAYQGRLEPGNDIPSASNTITGYLQPGNQKKYVHMYFAKYVGCWRAICKRLKISGQYQLISIGAGPLLCCIGWLWDSNPSDSDVIVKAYDALTWEEVRSLSEFGALWQQLSPRSPDYEALRYMPDEIRPPQINGLTGAQPISVSEIGSGNIVLLPSLLNHLVGRSNYVIRNQQRFIFDWIERVRRAGNTVVIADMPYRSDTVSFWERITTGLNAPPGSEELNFDFSTMVIEPAQFYSNSILIQRRMGLTPDANKAAVLLGTAGTGWKWLS